MGKNFPHLPGYLSLSREADPQHADGHGEKEPGTFQTKPSYGTEIHPGEADSYFSQEMVQQGSSRFMIPFNRQELADYLGVDRSALSNELGKMRKEGIIEVNRNQIHYLERV